METGGAVKDDDMDSVDLNDLTEEEGRKLDEALGNAFKAMKKASPGAAGGSQAKKSKSYRVQTTTVMHFRIRVLDLLEIYLQQPTPSLLIAIEIMLALYDMLEFCVSDELKPLQTKVEKVLNKLTALKSYKCDDDLTESNMVNFIRSIVEKKTPVVSFDINNKLKNKCIVFLIASSQKLQLTGNNLSTVLSVCEEYVQEFIKSRNPIVNITLLSEIVKLRWPAVWQLAFCLAEHGLNAQTRTFRRIQVVEILQVLYKNNDLHRSQMEATSKYLKKLEKFVRAYVMFLAESCQTAENHSAKELQTLLELLLLVQKTHMRHKTHSCLAETEICSDYIQTIRKHTRLEAAQVYHRYCAAFKLPIIRNNDALPNSSSNGNNSNDVSSAGETFSKALQKNATKPQTAKDSQKLKKAKKQQRMLAASAGLSESFSFTNGNAAANSDDDE